MFQGVSGRAGRGLDEKEGGAVPGSAGEKLSEADGSKVIDNIAQMDKIVTALPYAGYHVTGHAVDTVEPLTHTGKVFIVKKRSGRGRNCASRR